MAGPMASMPAGAEDRLSSLFQRIENRERTARRRAVIYSILPVALTGILLGYTALKIQQANTRVSTLRAEALAYTTQIETLKTNAETYKSRAVSLESQVSAYQTQMKQLQEQVNDTKRQLTAATDFAQFVRPLNYVDAKELASRFPGSERLLSLILDLRQRGVPWKLGGQSPQEGFDSPSFAMYILQQIRSSGVEPRPGESLLQASRRLYESLPPTQQPQTGDLVFYPAGYALFYFDDRREGPFVIGMTPFGITSLKPTFAQAIGYRRVVRN